MKIISLWQPFASLIFVGVKTFETRSFAYPKKMLGERVGIHATAKFTPPAMIGPELGEICTRLFGDDYYRTMPRSAILGTVVLSTCHSVHDIVDTISPENKAAGDWTPGRYAWALQDVKELATPVAAKGQQGWWNHEPLTFEYIEDMK